ncbi:MAG: hypothetical protein AAF957_01590 [Planctomycetota bacterium]
MSNPIPLVIAASLGAGAAGAVATTILVAPPQPAETADTTARADSELLAAIDGLRAENRALVERIDALELSSELAPVAVGGRTAATTERSDIEDVVKEVLGSLDGTGTAAPTPAMQTAIESVLDMREERERLERDQKRAEAQERRMEDRLAKLQTELGLDQNQVNSMRTIFQDEDIRRDELRTKMREARDSGNMDFGDVRQMWTDSRDATNQSIQGVLTPSQYEQYQETQQNDRWGRRGGGDAGRDGGGNNGGGGGGGGRGRRGGF